MTSTTRRRLLHLAGAALAMPFVSRLAVAQAWPARPIRAIVPFSAGSSTDIVARVVLDQVGAQLGQPIIIENRGGAGGTIGSTQVAIAPADGYTLLAHSSAHSAAPATYPKTPYDVAGDFSGVAMFGVVPNVVVVSPEKGFKTLNDLIVAAKKGNMTFASAGAGSATHWAAERLRLAAGFQATHVPFRGGPEGLTEVMTGRVDFMCVGVSSGIPLVKDGKLVPLAVSTKVRSSAMPNVPTTEEAGVRDADYTFWNGLLVSSKTPKPIIERLHDEVEKAVRTQAVKDKFAPQGIELMPVTPAEFDALIRAEIATNLAIVKAANLKFN